MRGPGSDLNFAAEEYEGDELLARLRDLPKKEMVLALRKSVSEDVSWGEEGAEGRR
jgi:hypothetical protein